MANVDSPFGLRPVRYVSGAPYNGAANLYYFAADASIAAYIGDPVYASGTAVGGIEQVTNTGTIDDATPANNTPIVGVVVGFASSKAGTQLRDDNRYVAAGATSYALVADDPSLLFHIQEDGNLGNAGVGNCFNIEAAAGSTVTGLSGAEIDSSAVGTDADRNLKVLRLAQTPKNSVGTNAVWEVIIQNHRNSTLKAGV